MNQADAIDVYKAINEVERSHTAYSVLGIIASLSNQPEIVEIARDMQRKISYKNHVGVATQAAAEMDYAVERIQILKMRIENLEKEMYRLNEELIRNQTVSQTSERALSAVDRQVYHLKKVVKLAASKLCLKKHRSESCLERKLKLSRQCLTCFAQSTLKHHGKA